LTGDQLQFDHCLIVAEVAQAHEGSLGMAHAFIDAIAGTGADAVKFQTHIAAAESSPQEPWRVNFSYQDPSRYDYWRRMEFTAEQWQGLADHTRARGMIFLSSPFSLEAADLLQKLDICAWKVGSGELTNVRLLNYMIATGKPVILSTGMSLPEEIDKSVKLVQNAGNELLVLQCTSKYPCAPEDVGLNMLDFYRQRYGCKVGLSDHSASIFPGITAAVLGASMVEVHTTLSPHMFGPDVKASLTIEELKQLVNGVRYVEAMLKNPVNKELMAASLNDLRSVFYKSLAARRDIMAGEILTEDMVCELKAGAGGIMPDQLNMFLGRRFTKAVTIGNKIQKEDFTDGEAESSSSFS